MSARICVLGCGPAGMVTALGLAQLGHEVTLVGEIRPYPVCEGISPRVCQALVDKQLRYALGTVSKPVRRYAQWGGQGREANVEHLLYRPDFDRAMLEDLSRQGIPWLQGRIRGQVPRESGWSIEVDTAEGRETREADFIVEARGRAATLAGGKRERGPETVSLACNWQGEKNDPFTAVASLEQGWLWLARFTDGRFFTQFSTYAKNPLLPAKQEIRSLLDRMLDALKLPGVSLVERAPRGTPLARSSTAILPGEAYSSGCLRVGDAAMAVDPLSGNGIFQSLSSALAAAPVINTLLRRPGDADMALAFYRDRLHHLFFRFARIGRDFYRDETRWHDQPFWLQRRGWPDEEPSHVEHDRVIGHAERPVIHHGFIETRTVVITADQPLGAAHLAP